MKACTSLSVSAGDKQSPILLMFLKWKKQTLQVLGTCLSSDMYSSNKKAKHHFDAVTVNSKEIDRVDSVKLLGVTITSTLQWNCHVLEVIKKPNKRMYFLTLLKRANVPAHDIICFYRTCIRPVLEYCAPLYHHALPDYLTKDIERIQRRALAIITPDLSYSESLLLYNMVSLEHRRSNQCNKFFESIVNNPDHKLRQLLPPTFTCKYNLRNPR